MDVQQRFRANLHGLPRDRAPRVEPFRVVRR